MHVYLKYVHYYDLAELLMLQNQTTLAPGLRTGVACDDAIMFDYLTELMGTVR